MNKWKIFKIVVFVLLLIAFGVVLKVEMEPQDRFTYLTPLGFLIAIWFEAF